MSKLTIILLATLAGCAAKPYVQVLDVAPAQTRSLAVAHAECEMVRLDYQTSPKHGEAGLAHNRNFDAREKAVFESMAIVEVTLQAKKMYQLCMRTKGWEQF